MSELLTQDQIRTNMERAEGQAKAFRSMSPPDEATAKGFDEMAAMWRGRLDGGGGGGGAWSGQGVAAPGLAPAEDGGASPKASPWAGVTDSAKDAGKGGASSWGQGPSPSQAQDEGDAAGGAGRFFGNLLSSVFQPAPMIAMPDRRGYSPTFQRAAVRRRPKGRAREPNKPEPPPKIETPLEAPPKAHGWKKLAVGGVVAAVAGAAIGVVVRGRR